MCSIEDVRRVTRDEFQKIYAVERERAKQDRWKIIGLLLVLVVSAVFSLIRDHVVLGEHTKDGHPNEIKLSLARIEERQEHFKEDIQQIKKKLGLIE